MESSPRTGSGRLLLHGDAVLSDLIGEATFRFGFGQLPHAKILVRIPPGGSRRRPAAGVMTFPEVIERPKLQSEIIGQMEVRGIEAQFVVDHVAPQRPWVSVVGKHPDLSSLDHDSRLPAQIPEQRATAVRPRRIGRGAGRAEPLTRAGTGTRTRARTVAETRVGPALEPLPRPAWDLHSSRCRDRRGTCTRAVAETGVGPALEPLPAAANRVVSLTVLGA